MRYAAFLSYAHRYRDWVAVLQRNLERGLACHPPGSDAKVFLDEVDLGVGRPWVGQLEAGLAQADRFVLIVTPEALASPWAGVEQDGFRAARTDWQVRFVLARLVDAPLTPFLAGLQYADFSEPDEERAPERRRAHAQRRRARDGEGDAFRADDVARAGQPRR